jgi:hypothetical protein
VPDEDAVTVKATADRVVPGDPAPHGRGWVRAVLALGAAAIIGSGIALGLVLSNGTNPTLPTDQAAQLTSVQTGCQQWLSADPSQPGSDQWCTQMTNWMEQEIQHNGIGPQMMWGNPTDLQSACDQWMTASSPSGAATNAQGWCSSMVTWMNSNVGTWSGRGSWGGWMRNGPMMGGFGP